MAGLRLELGSGSPGRNVTAPPVRAGPTFIDSQVLQLGVFVNCDQLLISRIPTNLLDNTHRHATTGVTVAV
ncbi:hypothetical protein ACIBI9_58565 [Nonomuraea sp. NPDC050451]|uniref:hypothetical protein n=1 Tax=Nonomuraea sp. NPDC050451 TaxID=3364364 RepID=UPI0037B174A6